MAKKQYSSIEKLAYAARKWIRTPQSVLVHTIFFILVYGLMLVFPKNKDQIVNLITNIVSIEAIYLTLFVLMGTHEVRQGVRDVAENVEDILEDTEDLTEDDIIEKGK